MSYISRVEKKRELDAKKAQQFKMKKRLRLAGLSLSVIAVVLVVFLAIRVLGNHDVNQEATVVTPKLTSPSEQSTKVVDQGDSNKSNDSNKTPSDNTGNDAAKGDNDNKQTDAVDPTKPDQNTDSDKGSSNDVNKEANVDNANTNTNGTNVTNTTDKPAGSKDKKAQKVVYLTFDDGPNEHTESLLKILDKYGIHATFFVIGSNLKGNEQELKNVVEAGHYVGLHSMTHDPKKLYKSGSSANFIKEFTKEQGLVKDVIGTAPVLIRPPYGSSPNINKKFRDDIVAANFKMWDWTVDSLDWKYPKNTDKIINEVKRQVHRDTEVILMHEKAQTVKVLPTIIEYLQKKGYAFAVYKPDHHITVNFAKDKRL